MRRPRNRQQAAAPVVARCSACGARFTSRYAAKTHECRDPAELERDRTA